MSYNWKCCSFYPNNFDASALIVIYDLFSSNQYTWLLFQSVYPKMCSIFYLILLTVWLYKILYYKIGI